mmetsp:Transcript_6181/g.18522  ORF Transcript_6181/g.18522 Transcript_6181/m.18522 type:complete len:200 (-) Transcript_6181:145-744(-)
MVKLFGHVLAELEPGAPCREGPPWGVCRVRPEQVADGAIVGHLLDAVEVPDVVQGRQAGGEARMCAEDPVLDHGSEGQIVEDVHEGLPDPRVAIQPHALLIETVHLCDLPGLVVAAKQHYSLRMADLEEEDQGHSPHAAEAAVNVVAKEQIVGVRRRTAYVQHLLDVLELTVNVAHDSDGAPRLDAVWLVLQQPVGPLT